MLSENQSKVQAHNISDSKNGWHYDEVKKMFDLPFNDLIHMAQTAHRENFDPNTIQLSTLCNIKVGGCPEDCSYCSQSVRYQTGVKAEKLMAVGDVISAARLAKKNGASRFCMGAAWRNPKERDFARVLEMVRAVKGLGLETCATLGMLTEDQASRLKQAGLDFYNHNIDTSPEYYKEIISTRTYEDRLNTLDNVRNADINVCSGGIIGMGETRDDRIGMLLTLANLPTHPQSVPINMLAKMEGTPMAGVDDIDPLEIVRVIAVARIMMPTSYVRLSAGRTEMSDETQALWFLAGANSIFYGEKLLTTENPQHDKDQELFERLGLQAQT